MALKFHREDSRKQLTPVRDEDASLFEERWQAELKAVEYGLRHGSFSVQPLKGSDPNG